MGPTSNGEFRPPERTKLAGASSHLSRIREQRENDITTQITDQIDKQISFGKDSDTREVRDEQRAKKKEELKARRSGRGKQPNKTVEVDDWRVERGDVVIDVGPLRKKYRLIEEATRDLREEERGRVNCFIDCHYEEFTSLNVRNMFWTDSRVQRSTTPFIVVPFQQAEMEQ